MVGGLLALSCAFASFGEVTVGWQACFEPGVFFLHDAAHFLYLLLGGAIALAVGQFFLPGEAYKVGGTIDAHLLQVGHRYAHQVVSLPARGTPHLAALAEITAHDEHHFPVFELIEIFASGDAYLAHEQLIVVVSGYAFFGFSSSASSSDCLLSGLSATTVGILYHLALNSITDVISCCTSSGSAS